MLVRINWMHAAAIVMGFLLWPGIADARVLFEDYFDTDVLSPEWVSIKPAQWIENGELHSLDTGPGRDSYATVHDDDASWTDYTLTLKIDPLTVNCCNGVVENGEILFRTSEMQWSFLDPDGFYYRLSIFGPGRDLGQSLTLLRRRPGEAPVTLHRSLDFPLSSDPMDVRIAVRGPRIQVWIDQQMAIDLVDPEPLHFGGIGVGAIWESEATFDDVLVISIPAASYNPDNGHFYEFVPGYLSWSEARDEAASWSHHGQTGHLATITSASEQSFIEQLLDGVSIPAIDDFPQIWLGGSDSAQEGEWNWVTGPEAGDPFWEGGPEGVPIDGAYSNWATLNGLRLQPDDDSGGENFLSIEFNATPGSFPSDGMYQWNDADADRIGVGYVVEYSPLDADGDGVPDHLDVCLGTQIPESVPTGKLRQNRWALVDDDGVFDTVSPPAGSPGKSFTIDDTVGCSCEQIIEAQGLGRGHERFGCSIGAMGDWVALVNP